MFTRRNDDAVHVGKTSKTWQVNWGRARSHSMHGKLSGRLTGSIVLWWHCPVAFSHDVLRNTQGSVVRNPLPNTIIPNFFFVCRVCCVVPNCLFDRTKPSALCQSLRHLVPVTTFYFDVVTCVRTTGDRKKCRGLDASHQELQCQWNVLRFRRSDDVSAFTCWTPCDTHSREKCWKNHQRCVIQFTDVWQNRLALYLYSNCHHDTS